MNSLLAQLCLTCGSTLEALARAVSKKGFATSVNEIRFSLFLGWGREADLHVILSL